MDPITRASKQFLKESEAYWKTAQGHVLFMAVVPRFRGDLVKTLRLAEASPFCRRPLFLFEEAFEEEDAYFAALKASLGADYAALQKGAAEEGVSLPDLKEAPRTGQTTPAAQAAARAHEIAAALAGKLDGIDVALIPKQVISPKRFADAVIRAILTFSPDGAGLRLLVWKVPGETMSEMAKGRTAHFYVDEDALAEHLKHMGNESEGKTFRGLLISAAEASGKGEHGKAAILFGEARQFCKIRELVLEEAGVLVALGSCQFAAGKAEDAVRAYQEAALLAQGKEAFALVAQAALGEGAVRLQQKRYPEAVHAYRAAGAAAEQGKIAILQMEARRMEGIAALAAGR